MRPDHWTLTALYRIRFRGSDSIVPQGRRHMLKLIPPRAGRSPNWRIRGTYLGISVDRTSGAPDKVIARKVLTRIKGEIERGELSGKQELTFAGAAVAYLNAGGSSRFLKPITDHFGPRTLARQIDQVEIDACAVALYPQATAATRNRQVYSPISAILRHVGIRLDLRRPKGAQGQELTHWLRPDQARAMLAAASDIDEEFAAYLILVLYTGARRSEALGLEWATVDLASATALIPHTKNGRPRIIHLPPPVVAALARLDKTQRKVFRWATPSGLYKLLTQVEQACGFPIGIHMLRHTYATWMRLYAKLTPEELQRLGAWSDPKSVRRYDHVEALEIARAANALPNVERAPAVDHGKKGVSNS